MTNRAVLTIAALLLALAIGSACTSGDESEGGLRFYAEVAVEVEPQADDPLARLDAETKGGGSIRWWYEAPDRWRWEIASEGPSIDSGTLLTVSDGEVLWRYDDRSNTYQRAEAYALPDGLVLSPIFSAPLGPANAESIEAFMEQWRGRGADSEVRLGGEETVLGRRTQIVEIRPAWRSSSSSATASSAGQESEPPPTNTESSGGVVRISIDLERMFIMRWSVDGEGGGQSYSAEIAVLEYGDPIDGARFVFDPPSGAREVTDSASQSTASGGCGSRLGGTGFGVPKGFLRPSYVPPGFESRSSGAESGAAGCETVATWALLEDGDGGYILLRQRRRAGGVPAALRTGEPVEVNGNDGFASQDEGVSQLVWANGEIVAQLTSNALSPAELLRIAESAELATESAPPMEPATSSLPGYPPEVRTGDATVDAVVAAVLSRDANAIFALARFEDHACVLGSATQAYGSALICPEGTSEGTLMPGMSNGGCHGFMLRGPDDLHYDLPFVSPELKLYAVGRPAESDGSDAEHFVLFAVRIGDDDVWGYGLVTGRDGFASVNLGCGFTPTEMLERYATTPYLLEPPQ